MPKEHLGIGSVIMRKNSVHLALNICTYKRNDDIKKNLALLLSSKFFDDNDEEYFGNLEIFIVDNASELQLERHEKVHLFYNPNTGGAGGFQRGIEEIRKYNDKFTHVIFMDDDVSFELSCFYILFDFLRKVDEAYADRPVAGRMLDKDNPNIQWTAAEKWNGGEIEHVEFLRDITDTSNPYIPGKVIYDVDANYGGWWFCCYPYSFVKDNDVMPFFLHCDDVEYGLRCGKSPIIIEGVHVWHETWEKKMSPVMLYYDTRNTLFVNEMYGQLKNIREVQSQWKKTISEYHVNEDWLQEYMVIRALGDYIKGISWLEKVDAKHLHEKLIKVKGRRLINAFYWRKVDMLIKMLV